MNFASEGQIGKSLKAIPEKATAWCNNYLKPVMSQKKTSSHEDYEQKDNWRKRDVPSSSTWILPPGKRWQTKASSKRLRLGFTLARALAHAVLLIHLVQDDMLAAAKMEKSERGTTRRYADLLHALGGWKAS
eukprot:768517-Hanusia_phi.AAC.1